MPLATATEPATADAFGVRFIMYDQGKLVWCHVLRWAIDCLDDRAARSDEKCLARFERNRRFFELTASALYDAGHRTLGSAPSPSDGGQEP